MATIGLRDLYRAPITIGDGGVEEYGTPVKMAKAISAELSVEVAEADPLRGRRSRRGCKGICFGRIDAERQ